MSDAVPVQLDLFTGEPVKPQPARDAGGERTRKDSRTATAPARKTPSDEEPAKRELRSRGRPLKERLQRLASGQIRSVTLTDNQTRIVSARPAPSGALDVRIHRCFVDASDTTLQAVASFLFSRRRDAARKRALSVIREHFDRHRPATSARSPRRRLVLRPVGRCFDLRELRDGVNRRYFGGEIEVHITWGRRHAPGPARRGRSPRRRGCGFSIQLGSYDERRKVVRIHRCLDRPEVPRYVVESVVHHEMLHAAIPTAVVNGRRRIHPPEFRRRERLYRHHDEANRWIEENLHWLAEVRSAGRKR